MKIYSYILVLLLGVVLPLQAASEAEFQKLSKHYTLRADGSQELRVRKVLTLYTHTAMNGLYGETFIVYNPRFQDLQIHEAYTVQKDGSRVNTPANAFVEVLPSSAADAPAYNHLKEMVVVHTGLELGATIYLDYSIVSRPGYLPALDVFCPVKELSPIKEFVCTVETEKPAPLHCELLNSDVAPKKVTTAQGGQRVEWRLKNVKPLPYAYPSQYNRCGMVQKVASGVQPVVVASTYPSYAEALKLFGRQFVAGDEDVVKAKAEELTRNAGGDKQKMRNAIGQYMMLLYSRLGQVKVSLQESGYRLRPASEVISSGYGTQAELTNLDVALQRAAGLSAEVVVCTVRSSEADNMGLGGIVSVVAKSETDAMKVPRNGSEEADLQDFMTITDLQANPVTLKPEKQERVPVTRYTREATDTLANGYLMAHAEGRRYYMALDRYASTTSVAENILLPATPEHTFVTTVKIPAGTSWMKKADKEIVNSVGKVVFSYKLSDGTVEVTCTRVIGKQLISPRDYGQFYALMSEWNDVNNYLLVFRK